MPVSDAFKESAFGEATDAVWLELITVDHNDLAESLRFVNNLENITSNGNIFTAWPFRLTMPRDSEESPPSARLIIDNVSQEIAAAIRQIPTPASFTVQVVEAGTPDNVEVEHSGMSLKDVVITARIIQMTIGLDDLRTEAFPADSFGPTYFKGLFK